MKVFVLLFFLCISLMVLVAGCGETVSGVGKDITRIGQGTRKIFIRDSND